MGWWEIEGTEHVVGDLPLDVLEAAARDVIATYVTAWGRRPTKQEWEALLFGVLGAEEDDLRPIDEGVVTRIRVYVSSRPRDSGE